MAGVIRPLIWEIGDAALSSFQDYTVFEIPPDLYEALALAFKKSNDDDQFWVVPQKSLERLIGWFAPDVGFIKREMSFQSGKYTLHIYYLGGQERERAVAELANAFQLWLAVSAPKDRDQELDNRLFAEVSNAANWFDRQVDLGMEGSPDRCLEPREGRAFDIITQSIAAYLAEKPVVLGGKNCGHLILSGVKGNPFYGRDLHLFPPDHVASENREGYWSEFIKISTMTSPESQRMRIVASLHVRNYGALTPKSRFSSLDRHLDVFFPTRNGATIGRIRHGEIPFRLEGRNDEDVKPFYRYRNGADLFTAIRAFSGGAVIDSSKVAFEPICGDAGLWMLPRLGRGFGDRRLAAGQGTSWTDREAFAYYLTEVFAQIGLQPICNLERVSVDRGFSIASPWSGPSEPKDKTAEKTQKFQNQMQLTQARRGKLAGGALAGVPLRIAFFRLRDEAGDELRANLMTLFGQPDKESAGELRFQDGLVVQFKLAKSGILSEPLPSPPQIEPEVAARISKGKHQDIVRDRHRTLLEEREDQIRAYADKATSGWRGTAPWIALIEMPDKLRDKTHDPYVRVYRSIAAIGGVPQALLLEENGDTNQFKVRQGLRDGLRMLGIAGFDGIKTRGKNPNAIPANIRLLGLWTARRNEDFKAGERREACTFPIAIVHDENTLKVALPTRDGNGWNWMNYSSACVAIRTHQIPSYSKVRVTQRSDVFSQFYREVIESLVFDGKETVVMAEAENIRKEVPTMTNKGLTLGAWEIEGSPGKAPLRLRDGDTSVSVVRLNRADSKGASYCRSGVKGNVCGAFREPGRTRTFWAVRPPALSMSGNWNLKSAMLASRRNIGHPDHQLRKSDAEYFGEDRVAPSLEEIVVLSHSKMLSCSALVSLIRKLQLAHVTWDSATILPYPLHEASLLEKIVG